MQTDFHNAENLFPHPRFIRANLGPIPSGQKGRLDILYEI
jgi:hypothetical protein